MALTSTDQIHNQELKIEQQKTEAAIQENNLLKQLMIAGGNPGGIPNRPYDAPKEDPKNPYVPAPSRKLASANNIRKTNRPLGNDDDYGRGDVPGHPDWKLSHGKFFNEYGQPIQNPARGIDPSGNPITIPHLQQTPEEAEQNKQLHMDKYHQAMDYPPPSELDKWLQLYQRNGGSLRHLDPDMRRLILQRGAMKADAANNIRSLQSTGHQTVLDDNNPNRLKIIKQFKPPRA